VIDARAAAVNVAWLAASSRDAWALRRARTRLEAVQAARLAGYLAANCDTAFGRRHGFARLAGVASFQAAVPLATYDDLAPFVRRIADGEPRVLTAEPVRLLEPTGGSAGATKLVPYTASLAAEFRRALGAWIVDLFSRWPALAGGAAYWSVSPLAEDPRRTAGGIAIGFEADSAYLGAFGAALEAWAFAVPSAVKGLPDIEALRYVTLLCLLRRPDLRLVSVWSPTFLSLLLDALPRYWDRLVEDVRAGTSTLPASEGDPERREERRSRLGRAARPDPRRAARMARIGPDRPTDLWPALGLVSCWADGPAAPYAAALAARLPGVRVQPKGLLATEAFVSLPLGGGPGALLAATSHFFEFLPLAADGATDDSTPRLAHEIERGQAYSVVVTTGGGFYRYKLGDAVEVVGFLGQLPRLRFAGRVDRVSDRFGEKLSPRFVADALEALCRADDLRPEFAMLAPDDDADGLRYTLYLDLGAAPGFPADAEWRAELARRLDLELSRGFHYAQCRLGQLGGARVVLVTRGAEHYTEACRARGQRPGDVKPTPLATTTGWEHWLAPGDPGRSARP